MHYPKYQFSGFLKPVVLLLFALSTILPAAPVRLYEEAPTRIERLDDGVWLVDFGRVAFGNLKLLPPESSGLSREDPGQRSSRVNALPRVGDTINIHFGEAMKDGRVDREPPGTVRYAVAETQLEGGASRVVAPPPDERNTKQPAAILTPAEWGVVLPFRWVEIEGWPGELLPDQLVRRAAYSASWDDAAATFKSSDPLFNRIWELCKYSIKATTFAGVYVDGDRERIPYEADAYLNQLSHYATDHDVQMARDTFDRLMEYPTWPSEWAPHMVFMAYADWMHTGEADWLAPRYESLKSKLLMNRVGDDGMVRSNDKQQSWNDIVDWPQGERDGFVFTEVNAVVNAFHIAAIGRMAELARAVGKKKEAESYRRMEIQKRTTFNQLFLMEESGIYRDGVGTDHASLHANLFPLAFGLVPGDQADAVADFVAGKGMRCSVYAAQYLLEGLFNQDRCEVALELITAEGDRSWRHMVESGTTITWEAWDLKYKPNLDWNHAWGAAPANLLPHFVLGAEPLLPGWKQVRIRPCPGALTMASGTIPTPKGPIWVKWQNGITFDLQLNLPDGVKAQVELPLGGREGHASVNGQPADGLVRGSRLVLSLPVSGNCEIRMR